MSKYQPTPEDRTWLYRRLGYYGLQIGLFVLLAFQIGPNLILFNSPFSPGPAHYAELTGSYVPTIAAIKAYQRDFGKLPIDELYLPLEYRPPAHTGAQGEIDWTTSITFPLPDHVVLEYEFSPEKEGWSVHAPRYDGRIPAPIVTAAPKPTTQRSSSRPADTDGN